MLTGPQISSLVAPANLRNRLEETRTRIASAAMRCGRAPGSVALIAMSKAQEQAAIRSLAELGQRDFGENYVQEALPKLAALKELSLTWHFTGQLQGNKTRAVAEDFQWVHTLDRERIAARLNEQRPPDAPRLNVCLQVKLGEEIGKGGVSLQDLPQLATQVRAMPRLHLRGLMCIPPPRKELDQQLALCMELTSAQRELNDRGFSLDTLSMGMSNDLEAAIAAGATFVRIGTALFGERPKPVTS
jgi:pyridoxal phosphate enzyme (YggS family)